jgi:thioesterase domain-containing protein
MLTPRKCGLSYTGPTYSMEPKSLVLIRKGGDKPPLFLVHDGQGETLLYLNLANRFDKRHPVYGLQPYSRANVPIVHTRTAEMAAFFIEKIRSVQRQGPYLVGGLCVGGVIAFEVARQLQQEGEKVAMVALLDTADVAATRKRWHVASQRIRSFSTVFNKDASVRFDKFVFTVAANSLRKAKNLGMCLVHQRLEELRDVIRVRLLRYFADRPVRVPRLLERIPVQTVCLFAESQYRPQGLFEGELVLFRATSGEAADEPFAQRFDDPLLGWGRRSTGGVKVIDIPGGHYSMLQEPNVRVMADHMNLYVEGALACEATTVPGSAESRLAIA